MMSKSEAANVRPVGGRLGRGLTCAAAAVAMAGALAGCQTTGPTSTTSMLSAAGFTMKVADTPAKQAALASLPPNQISLRQVKGKNVFLYPDPKGCNCLYVGSDASYQAYKAMAFERSVAAQQVMAAQLNAQATWDYGIWGPPGFWW